MWFSTYLSGHFICFLHPSFCSHSRPEVWLFPFRQKDFSLFVHFFLQMILSFSFRIWTAQCRGQQNWKKSQNMAGGGGSLSSIRSHVEATPHNRRAVSMSLHYARSISSMLTICRWKKRTQRLFFIIIVFYSYKLKPN